MDNASDYVKALNDKGPATRITLTHLMTQACAWGLYKMRRDVGRLPFGTFKKSKDIGITVLVDVEGGKDLVPVTIWNAHAMTIDDIAKLISEKVQNAKKGKDAAHNQSTLMMNFIPSFIAQPLVFLCTYCSAVLGITVKPLGLRADAFGHLIITNVGTLGYTSAAAPLCPPTHQMALLCTGAIQKRAMVEERDGKDEIVIKRMMTAVGTGDHRYGDAAIFTPFFKTFRGYMEDPVNFDHTKYKDVPHYKELKAQ